MSSRTTAITFLAALSLSASTVAVAAPDVPEPRQAGGAITQGTLHQFFPDAGLAGAVLDKIDGDAQMGYPFVDFPVPASIDEGTVTAANLAGLAGTLQASDRGIRDLSGLTYLTGIGSELPLPCRGNCRSSYQKISLEKNGLTEITPGTFDGLSQLANLGLSDNLLTTLDADTFRGLDSLRTLDLNHNRLYSIFDDAFVELHGLSSLNLSQNRIIEITNGDLDGLGALMRLNLSENILKTLPVNVFHDVAALAELDLSDNMIESLPKGFLDHFGNEIELMSLNLDRNQLYDLSVLPNRLGHLQVNEQRVTRTFEVPALGTDVTEFTPPVGQVVLRGVTSGVEPNHPNYDGVKIKGVFKIKGDALEADIGPIETADKTLHIRHYIIRLVQKAAEPVVPTKLKLKLNVNGGNKVANASRTLAVGDAYGKLPTPKRTHYTFKGWYTKKSGGAKVTAKSTVPANAAQTLYARWKKQVKYAKVKSHTLTVRATASASGKIRGYLNAGKSFKVKKKLDRKGTRNDWYQLSFDGKKAYVSARYVKVYWV
jgi:uncharacterized repeat protein (TIGR02543 family)